MSLAHLINRCLLPLNLHVVRQSSLAGLIERSAESDHAAAVAVKRATAAEAAATEAGRRLEAVRTLLGARIEGMSTQLCDALAAGGPPIDQMYPAIRAAEAAVAAGDTELAWGHLRTLSLPAFAGLLLGVPRTTPALAAWLPTMPSDQVQRDWTGSAGFPLLTQSLSFVHGLDQGFLQHTGRSLAGVRVLDYGCGWGRLLRLLSWFVSPASLVGIDPWDRSIELCREHRVMAELAIGDYVPKDLPVAGPFDLVYAYSVFTHLSERTADAVLGSLRRHIAPDGLLVITIRPESYWLGHRFHDGDTVDRETLQRRHRERGFAFLPHDRAPIDGDITYGDTSMSLEFLATRWPRWRVAGTRALPADPAQLVVFLTPT